MVARVVEQQSLTETKLEDAHLNTLIDEHLAAKAALADAKAYMEDYIDQLALQDGEYRVGAYKLKVSTRKSIGVSTKRAKR